MKWYKVKKYEDGEQYTIINLKYFHYMGHNYGFWFRIFNYGLSFDKHSEHLPFSMRYGYTKYIKLFGYYIKPLKP